MSSISEIIRRCRSFTNSTNCTGWGIRWREWNRLLTLLACLPYVIEWKKGGPISHNVVHADVKNQRSLSRLKSPLVHGSSKLIIYSLLLSLLHECFDLFEMFKIRSCHSTLLNVNVHSYNGEFSAQNLLLVFSSSFFLSN